MASTIKVDKLDPQSGTALEIGTSGDTVTVPSGVGLTLTDSTLLLPTTIQTDKLDPKSGTDLELGSSGDTITIPSGATITNSGTATGFGGNNTPLFRAEVTATQSIPTATYTKVAFDTEVYDPQGTYDHTTNYRWTPAVAGYVYISASAGFGGAGDFNDFLCAVYKNGANISTTGGAFWNYDTRETHVIDLADDDDYYEAYVYQNSGGAKDLASNPNYTQFQGYKIIT
jgi:hypothetical protein